MVSPDSETDARFREIIAAEFPTLEGRQWPETMVCAPLADMSHGDKAIKLAKRLGVRLMPWQQEQVRRALMVDDQGRWCHSDIVLICPRQNGKSLILEVIVLYRLFVLNHKIIFTAQRWSTAKSIRNRLWKRIKMKAWAARRLTRNTASAGEAEMETDEGGKVQFTTRSNDAGRGFDEVDLLILDEAYNLEAGELDALGPIQLASKDPQTYYTSSAVNQDQQVKGELLSTTRHRVLGGEADGVFFSEFRAPEGLDPSDPATWRMANPSYGVVASEKKIRSMKTKLSKVGFEVEMLGWGRWFQPAGDGQSGILDMQEWAARTASAPAAVGESCLGFDTDPDGARSALVVAYRTGGGVHLMLNPNIDRFVRDDAVAAMKSAVEKNDPLGVCLDPKGPAGTIADPLSKARVSAEQMTWTQISAACELFLRMFAEGKITHCGDSRWEEALEVAEFRPGTRSGRAFKHTAPIVSVLVAAASALWGLIEFEIPTDPVDVKRKQKFVGHAEPVPAAPMAAAGAMRF